MKKEIKNQRLCIIFGEEHYNPLNLIRSLGEEGIKPVAIILKGDFPFASKSKYISKLHMVDSIEEGYELLLDLYGNEKIKPMLYTSDDTITSFLDEHYNELCNKFIFYNAGEQGKLTYYLDKNNINILANKHGLMIPKSRIVKSGEIPSDLIYPVVTKAINSTIKDWKDESIVCNSEQELSLAYKNIKSKKIMLQQYIDKKNEIALHGISVNNGKNVYFTVETTFHSILENSYSRYLIVKKNDNTKLEEKISNMLKEIGFEGLFEAEFLVDKNDELYFLEINLRNSAFIYTSTVAGMNMPVLWKQLMLNEIDDKDVVKDFEPFNAMAEFIDYKDRVINTKEVSRFTWFKQMLGCKCLFFCNKHDMKPVISKFTHKIKKVLRLAK